MPRLIDRRSILQSSGMLAMSFTISGCDVLTTPGDARKRGAELKTLNKDEAVILDRLADTLLPGAREAGFVNFIDAQISSPVGESLSLLRYLDWDAPYSSFYKSGLRAMDEMSKQRFQRSFLQLSDIDAQAFVKSFLSGDVAEWLGDAPPPFLWYFVTRSDAVDVFYGTKEGFEQLDIPYFEHILPNQKW